MTNSAEDFATPPPGRRVALKEWGAVGGWLHRSTWPFGRFIATNEEVRVFDIIGRRHRASRESVEAIEFSRGPWRPKVWVVLRQGGQLPIWFSPSDLVPFLDAVRSLGWPIRERR